MAIQSTDCEGSNIARDDGQEDGSNGNAAIQEAADTEGFSQSR